LASRSSIVSALKCWVVATVLAVSATLGSGTAIAREPPPAPGAVALQALPVEAQQTYRLILAGGPFPHPQDGAVFGNRERRLPPRERGWYREYTVATPGARDRAARRIVCGGQPPTQPQACYYTADHYASFQRIAP
jgi:ribonuclease T1